MTIHQLFNECWAEHWDQPRFRLSGHAKEVQSKYYNHIRPTFGELEYLGVTRSQIRDFHKRYRETPVTGNRLLEILSKLYRFSIDKEWNQNGFNPCFGVKHFTERKRRRYATEAEIKRISLIFEREYSKSPIEITFLYALLFTGARPRSIERAKWHELTEIEGGFGQLVFEGKSTHETGDMESVIIPPFVMDLFNKLEKRTDGLILGIPLPGYLWRRIRKEAGCNDLWARDLRRTFATIGFNNGVDKGVVGRLLNHHSPATTDRYVLLNNTAGVKAVSTISDKLNSILKK
jgi:integrase